MTSNGFLLSIFEELGGASWGTTDPSLVTDGRGGWELAAPTDLDDLHAPLSLGVANSMLSKNGSVMLTVSNIGGTPARAAVGGMAGPSDSADPDILTSWPASADTFSTTRLI